MNLTILRKQKKLSQTQIANIIGTNQATYSNYEIEATEPKIETLKKLADYYNVSLDYLCDRKFVDEIGFLNEEQKQTVLKFKQLNSINQIKTTAYIDGLLTTQTY